MKNKKIAALLAAVVLSLSVAIPVISTNSTVQAAKYTKSKIKLPAGYTKSALLKAYKGKPSQKFLKASMKGMQNNSFSRTKAAESAKDNKTKVNPAKLTANQRRVLANYALRLINGARRQLNLPNWQYSAGTQKLAQDIATEYQDNGRSIKDGGHYVEGIVRACKKNGLDLNDNYVEDMAGYSSNKTRITMTQMKKNIYFGLKQMMFGYVGYSDKGRKQKKNYREWEHAGDLFNTQGSTHDGDFDYFGFSVSKTGNVYSIHYIGVPSYAVSNSKYNKSFRP